MTKRTSRITCFALVIIMAVSMMSAAFAASVMDFTDVPTSAWYYDAANYAASHGLFNGTSATTFSPDVPMSRGMFITVLGRLAGVPDSYGRTQTTPFSDVTQADYFFPYAAWAKDNGIVDGSSQFNPNRDISREDMTTYLYRYAVKGFYDTADEAEKYNMFPDTAKVSGYAVTAMLWATTHGVINGSDGKLSPQGSATRAQVAQIFLNFSQLETTESSESDESEPADWENYNPAYTVPTGKSAVDANGGYYDYDLAKEIMAQVNTLRIEKGLPALLYHPKIQAWASIRAQEQSNREGHTRPDGSVYSSVGSGLTFENITILRNCSESELSDISALAERAVNNWYTSTKGHKEAMLSAASNFGTVACYVKGSTVDVVELFSNRTPYYFDFLI